jgi:two-component system, NtrC family, sensor kinase
MSAVSHTHLDPRSPSLPLARQPLRGTSIVWKLTLFVGVLVTLIGGALIAAAYFTTAKILRDQIHQRLRTVATDRQKMLASTLRQYEERATRFARRNRIHQLLMRRANGTITPDEFRREAENFLSAAMTTTAGVLAMWVEDDAGRVIASSGPEDMVAAFARLERTDESPDGGLVVPPRRVGETFAMVFSAVVRDRVTLGRVMLLTDFAPIGSILMDPNGLGETGEVLVGIGDGEKISLVLPLRTSSPVSEVPASEFPSLSAGIAGEFGFTHTIDYGGRDVLVAYRPVGSVYKSWGLVAKIDSAEAYRPIGELRWPLLVSGGVALALGLLASNALARRVARPIRRLARTSAAVAAGDYTARIEVTSSDEIGALSAAFNRMTEQLSRSYSSLEERITDRTRELEALRDLLDAFFQISTSRLDPHNIDRTFDSVLRFCTQLGYDHAMISLVDQSAGVIRAARAMGTMTHLVELTVRSLDGDDILAMVAREGQVVVVPDSRLDWRCDQEAIGVSGIRGQVVLPLASDELLGTLQVASRGPIDPDSLDLRPLETLASHTARALTGLRQLEEIRRLNQTSEQHAQELARSEAALREQTQILQSVLDRMGDGVVVADSNARFLIFNPAAERILGHGRIDSPPEDWSRNYEIFLPDRATPYPVAELPLWRAIRGESVDSAELYIAYPSRDDGTWILVNARPLRDEHGELSGGVVVFHDITRRKKSESRLAAQYEATRVLAEADSPAQATQKILETICEGLDWDHGAFWRVDSRTQRLRCATIWQKPSLVAPRFTELTREITLERGQGLLGCVWAGAHPAWVAELAHQPDGPRGEAAAAAGLHAAFAVPITLRGECLGVLEFFSRELRQPDPAILEMMNSLGTQIGQHIERHQMRARVVQSEKLASLGLLSAGVAHEINNPLAYVATNLAVLDRDVRFLLNLLSIYERGADSLTATHPELIHQAERLAGEFDLAHVKETMGKTLQSTRQGIKRVAEIVQNLRGFARLDRAEVDQADIHEAIHAAVEMLRGRMDRRRITIEQHLSEVPPVAGSPAQLNQVFMNLLVNAMQAIESTNRGDGRILITTECRNGEIMVEVADNGCGIADDVLPHIFDPFFTTKATGDGTGLGLSITHSLVQDHGGRLDVESLPGHGTRFRVFLPVARGPSRLAVD